MQLFKDAASEVIVLCFATYMLYRIAAKWIDRYYATMPAIYQEGVAALKDLATSIRIATLELSKEMEMVSRSQTAIWNEMDHFKRSYEVPDAQTGTRPAAT